MIMQILFAVQQTFLFKSAFVYGGDKSKYNCAF